MIDLDSIIKDGNVLVYFYADWCARCKVLSKEIDKLKNISIFKVDVDKNRNLCKKYGVMSVPTLIYFKKDGTYTSKNGLLSYDELLSFIKK